VKQAVDQVAQATAGDQRKGDALKQPEAARAQDIDQRAGQQGACEDYEQGNTSRRRHAGAQAAE
jgi:hypothetical protein